MPTAVAQVVQSVTFGVQSDNTIEVAYYLSPSQPEQSYEIELLASKDGGVSYFKAKAVSGDVGEVSRAGSKRIIWRVFSDVESFEGEQCGIKVMAKEIHPIGESIMNVLFGSKPTKALFDGLHFHAGWEKTTFSGSTYQAALDRGTVQTSGGVELGVKYLTLPFAFECDGFLQTFRINGSDAVNFSGINVSGNITLFPMAGFFLPSVGIGYQGSELYVGDSPGSATSQAATNAIFATVGGQLRLTESFSVGIDFKKSIGSGDREWVQLIVFLSYNYRK
jgi:hypothetical protein